MQCAGCTTRNKPDDAFKIAPCARCAKMGFYCARCAAAPACRACKAKHPAATNKKQQLPPTDYLAKPWPVEAQGCRGCVYELRAPTAAPFGMHTCGADEERSPDDEEAPPIEHGPETMLPELADVREPPVRPVAPKMPRAHRERKRLLRERRRNRKREERAAEVALLRGRLLALAEEMRVLAADMTSTELRSAIKEADKARKRLTVLGKL